MMNLLCSTKLQADVWVCVYMWDQRKQWEKREREKRVESGGSVREMSKMSFFSTSSKALSSAIVTRLAIQWLDVMPTSKQTFPLHCEQEKPIRFLYVQVDAQI